MPNSFQFCCPGIWQMSGPPESSCNEENIGRSLLVHCRWHTARAKSLLHICPEEPCKSNSYVCHIDFVVNNSNKPALDIQMYFCGNFLLDAPSQTISEYSLSKRIEYSTNSYNSHTHTPTSQKLILYSGGSRISPRRGANSPRGGANIRFCHIFPKTAWNWKNLGPPGGGASPLRSATASIYIWSHMDSRSTRSHFSWQERLNKSHQI